MLSGFLQREMEAVLAEHWLMEVQCKEFLAFASSRPGRMTYLAGSDSGF